MTIDDDFKQHLPPTLEYIGLALAQFVRSLCPSGEFILHDKGWVFEPNNFVTFTPHYKRTDNISLSLRGHPDEFEKDNVLLLKPGRGARTGRGGYSECSITCAKQLAAAANYIERAYEIYLNRAPRLESQIAKQLKNLSPDAKKNLLARLAEAGIKIDLEA